ncbi:HAD family hydrolase [Nitratiruptor tergarcus]|uniref:phosphoglycolate phosphatase n=1 Tax=Nitratiruptor tergarcus DSM 16512 TaxID=1069081 RepID=A0A1W1WQD9_9BACT|nr:HAD family hydrolase [Nitratiruptor tergarcus]SMC08442.1 phosphoglycolate phosphatase [Nitratiruptor tergarcus DSM 16512]
MKKYTILFDLDGTIIDSTPAILRGFSYAFNKFGLSTPPHEKILSLIGHPLDFMFTHLGIKEDVEKFVDAYKEHYRVIAKDFTTLLPGAKEAVQEAVTFANLAVVTTKTGVYSIELLQHLGLMDCFEVVIGRENVIHPKPHPEPLLKAMHILQAHKEYTFMIGDTCLDMEAAKAAEVKGVGVLCGYGNKEELQRCAHWLKKDAFEAVLFIKKLSKSNN